MKKYLLFSTIVCVSLQATLQDPLPSDSEINIHVSQRPTSAEDLQKMKERKEDLYQEEMNEKNSSISENDLQAHRGRNPFESKNYFFRDSPAIPNHWVVASNIDGSILEIEDGSHWKISGNYSISNWRVGDIITVTPNRSWFSDYKYYIVNKSIDTYVEADLILGPLAFGPLTHWVVSFDFNSGKVYLENGACFKVPSSDYFLFEQWQVNDTIILGTNDSWFSSYDTLLINVNMNHFVRAKNY